MHQLRRSGALALVVVGAGLASGVWAPVAAQSDLEALMRRVVERRDESWKQLQQYILDEREVIEVQGPGGRPVWGERREFSWYIRDGFFVRSPVRINGAQVSESDRRRAEDRYLRRAQRRDERARAADDADPPPATPATDVSAILQQTRAPEFVTSDNFLRFAFDAGRYALVGRETLDGRDVLRVEYYPTRLFEPNDDDRRVARRRQRDQSPEERARNDETSAEIRRLMNKGSLVTLWVDQQREQIVKYVFDNAALDFFPGRWLVYADNASAFMEMAEAFPGIWLPARLGMDIALTSAMGPFALEYRVDYHDYRQPDVTSVIRVPGAPEPRRR